MDWLSGLFTVHSAVQTVFILSVVCSVGLALGKIKFFGISLGIAFVFFIGIVAGNFGISVDAQMSNYAETFGLALFVYTLGLDVGPNFFGSLKHEGVMLNLWGLAIILVGTVMALLLCEVTAVPVSDMVGLLCGATTNTPALGAAQQALSHMGVSASGATLGCAVTYPMGVVGVILAMMFIRKFFVRPSDMPRKSENDDDHTYVAQFEVRNEALEGKSIAEISQNSHIKFIISRVWRDGQVIVPMSTTHLHLGDNVLVVTNDDEVNAIEMLFGKMVEKDWNKGKIDWNHIDSKVESRVIVMTRAALNGKMLGKLQLRKTYGVNVSRVIRGDITLLASPDRRLKYGDRLTVVGEPQDLDNVEKFLGNVVQILNEPNLSAIFLGLLVGLALGTIPIDIPGMSVPVRLGIAGGPILVGILMGAFGPRLHIISYTTHSASLMLRKLGLSLYLASLGLGAGSKFLETVIRPEGLLWVGLGFLLTVIPVVIVGIIALRSGKLDFGSVCGIMCGSMANPMALSYAHDTLEGETPAVSYATVYPLGMFIRVIITQIVVMAFV